jgi:glycosyltransferase involved in cell wall biosynthesis
VLHYLAQRHDLHVITFREPGAAVPAFPPNIRADVVDLPRNSKSAAARALRNLSRAARGVPPLIDRFSGFGPQIHDLLRPPYEVAVIEHFWAAQYGPVLRPHARKLVLDLHNIESTLLDRTARTEPPQTRPLFRRWAAACRAMEARTLPLFDLILTTSLADSSQLRCPSVTVPNTIPFTPRPSPSTRRAHEIVFSGNMEYHPNRTAVRWFVHEIWPILRATGPPEITVRFLGRNEHAIAPLLAADPGRLHATGPVPDAVSALAESAVAMVPLTAGSGTRIKIIEAWAAGLPVVSTSIGAEGLPGHPGRHLLTADSPGEFAAAIVKVLQNPSLACQLSDNGRRLYEEELTWEAAWKALSQAGL